MKKLNLLLAGLMVLGLASCGRGEIKDTLPIAPSVKPAPLPPKPNEPIKTPEATDKTETPDINNPEKPDINNPEKPDNPYVPTDDGCILKDGRVGYQIFVNTFADGNKENNKPTDSGDIEGIIDNLDYLKTYLNVEVLWLTPIHKAASYNGYDPSDYRSVKAAFGGMEAYEKLLEEAHKRGIYVMLDLVINHTSATAEWFRESKAGNELYKDYYRWSDTKPGDKWYPNSKDDPTAYYYGLFWDQMPDLNYDSPKLYDEMLDICKGWIDKGVDGFRIDGAKHVYNYDKDFGGYEITNVPGDLRKINWEKNLDFFKKFNKDIKEYDKDTFLTLEVLDYNSDVTKEYLKQGVDSCFDFSTKKGIIDNINSGNGANISYAYAANQAKYAESNPYGLNSLVLGNHDMNRVFSELDHNEGKAKAAAAIEMLLPGLAWIYNGDELGMSGSTATTLNNEDLTYRQPYKWGNDYDTKLITIEGVSNEPDNYTKAMMSSESQRKDKGSMLNFYKDLTHLKATDDVIRNGSFEAVKVDNRVTAFKRSLNGKTYLCAVNVTGDNVDFSYDLKNASKVYFNKASMTEDKVSMTGYGVAVIEIESIKAPECNTVTIKFKGVTGATVVNHSVSPAVSKELVMGDDGYQTVSFDITGKNLSSFTYSINKGDEVISPVKTVSITPDENKTFTITIDASTNEYKYVVDIDPAWGFNSSNQKFMIWAWSDKIDSNWYVAKVVNGKLEFSLDKSLDKCVIVIFDKFQKPDWTKKIKQTVDLTLNDGVISTPITWK